MRAFLNSLFGCAHRRMTFPLTPARRKGFAATNTKGTYVVCLDCGMEFAYHWKDMKVGEAQEQMVLGSSAAVIRLQEGN